MNHYALTFLEKFINCSNCIRMIVCTACRENPLQNPLAPSSYAITLTACNRPEYRVGIIPA